jgi:CRP-like cAMP-binding protein
VERQQQMLLRLEQLGQPTELALRILRTMRLIHESMQTSLAAGGTAIYQTFVRNRLLRVLGTEDFADVTRQAEPVVLRVGDTIVAANQPGEWVYFVEEGMVGSSLSYDRIEIGPIGREGVVAAQLLVPDAQSPFMHNVQLHGDALRLGVDVFHSLVRNSPALSTVIARYAHFHNLQTAEAAVVNARCDVEQRLARWILMCRDRSENDVLGFTHSTVAGRIGVRRASVTEAMHKLESARAVKASRTKVSVVSRAILEERAGSAYGFARHEYERLIGRTPLHTPGAI